MSFIKMGNPGGGAGLGGSKELGLGHVELAVPGVMQIELLSGIWGKICAGDMVWKVTSKEVQVKDLGTD